MSFSFVVIADPQFGMYSALSGLDNAGYDQISTLWSNVTAAPKVFGMQYETVRYERVIEAVNRLKPEFVVTCGDMCNDKEEPSEEYAELMRITNKLSSDIKMHWVPGNHDVGNIPTAKLISRFHRLYGKDMYSFNVQDSHFLVMNSSVSQDPSMVPQEWESQLEFLDSDLQEASKRGSKHIVVFAHHPLFVLFSEESDSWLVIPKERRKIILDMFVKYGVSHMFAGHWHRNHYSYLRNLQIIVTSSVGYPLGPDPSGIRIVRVTDDYIGHKFFPLNDLPTQLEI